MSEGERLESENMKYKYGPDLLDLAYPLLIEEKTWQGKSWENFTDTEIGDY